MQIINPLQGLSCKNVVKKFRNFDNF